MTEFKKADKRKRPSPDNLFTDVYDTMLKHIREQYENMKRHISKFPEHYPLEHYEKIKEL